MKWFIAVLIAALTVGAPATGASSAASTKKCTQVAFTPNSDDTAAEIRATGLTCGLARDFVRDSEGRPGKRFRGFACTRAQVDGGELPYTRYRCIGAGDVISWRRY